MVEPTPELAEIVAEAEHYGYVIRAIDHYEGPTGDDLLPAIRAALEQRADLVGVLGEGVELMNSGYGSQRSRDWLDKAKALLACSATAKEGVERG